MPDEVFTKEFKLPVTDGSGNMRDRQRRALGLLKEAGWEVKDGKMASKDGKQLAFEILLNDASFERIALPFKQNLERLGIEHERAHRRPGAVPSAAMDEFDFDMTVDGFGQSLSPGNEQRDFWGSQGRRHAGQPQHRSASRTR